MVTPIIATIKNIIDDKEKDKKIVVDTSKLINQNHHSIHNLGSLKDTDIIGSEDIFTTDSSSLDRSTNTEKKKKKKTKTGNFSIDSFEK